MKFQKSTVKTIITLAVFASSTFMFSSCDIIEVAKKHTSKQRVSQAEIVAGLKEALNVGTDLMVDSAGLSNGYWKRGIADGFDAKDAIQILLPQEAIDALDATETMSANFNGWKSDLSDASFGTSDLILSLLDIEFIDDLSKMQTLKGELWKSLNRAAEHAAPKSKKILLKSITQMSLEDGSTILFSDDSTSATSYLHKTSYDELFKVFEPMVANSLNAVDATQIWKEYSALYNNYLTSYQDLQASISTNSLVPKSLKQSLELPESFPKTLPNDLTAYTTEYALEGLFTLVSQEEVRIRANPLDYVENLIQDIFTLVEGEFILED